MSAPRLLLPLLLLLASACATVTPMQTASVVDPGHFRVGGQLSGAGLCGDFAAGLLGFLGRCTDYPDGVPLPELRLDGRYGFTSGFDVGLSLQALGQLFAPSRPFQGGLTGDVKLQLARVTVGEVTHLVSVGFLVGGALAGRDGLPLWTQVEFGVPAFYGLQLEHWELVAGVQVTQRLGFGPNGYTPRVNVGFSLGAFRRDPAGIGLQLAYLTDPSRFSDGALQLQVGYFFDL
jgi:hypothetical protein